jgi:uncharacterized protein
MTDANQRSIDRRKFLRFMGGGALALSMGGGSSLLLSCATSRGGNGKLIPSGSDFRALTPSDEDVLRLATGLKYRVVARWGDKLNENGLTFGFNNDFLAYFPRGKGEGLLCVNHETPDPLFVSGYTDDSKSKTIEQVRKEMDATGVSVVHIKESGPGQWTVVKNSPLNKGVRGQTPIPIVAERALMGGNTALGTVGNCAGGVTPWGTYLTCEENFDLFYGDVRFNKDGKRMFLSTEAFNWHNHFPQPPEHYGWVVEINPDSGEAKKLTSLGRFSHEGATVVTSTDGRSVVYMGDDAAGQCLYKFIAAKKDSLHEGTLYVAQLGTGRWIPLVHSQHRTLQSRFKDQLEVLVRCREAAALLKGTPLDRPEDIEVCPKTKAVYVTLTNNRKSGNLFGSILKVDEKDADPLALEFKSSTFASGGSQSGFACPDNLAFDPRGNLWMTTDMSESVMNRFPYAEFKNNGLFYFPLSGPEAGRGFLVGTAPKDAELTGPTFSPDGRTLFLSVQHPGSASKGLTQLTSHWPDGGKSIPKPSVVAISGEFLDKLTAI